MMKRWIVSAIAVLAITPSGCQQPPSGSGTRPSNWLKVDPSKIADAREMPPPRILPETHFAAGQLLEAQGQFDHSLAQYQRAVLLNHNYVGAYHRMGALLARLGRHREAIDALARAVELRPQEPVLHNNLGFEYLVVSDHQAAETHLRRAIELDVTFERARINLGIVLCRQERFDEALEEFRAVLPEAEAHYNLGLMYCGVRRYRDAGLAYHRALQLDPNLIAARTQLAYLSRYAEVTETTAAPAPMLEEPAAAEGAAIEVQALSGTSTDEASADDDCEDSDGTSPVVLHDESAFPVEDPGSLVEWPDGLEALAPADSDPLAAEALINPFAMPHEWMASMTDSSGAPTDLWIQEFIRESAPAPEELVEADADCGDPSPQVSEGVRTEGTEPVAPDSPNPAADDPGEAPAEETVEDEASAATPAPIDTLELVDTPAVPGQVGHEAWPPIVELPTDRDFEAAADDEPAVALLDVSDASTDAWLELYIDDCTAYESQNLDIADGWGELMADLFAAADVDAVKEGESVHVSALSGETPPPPPGALPIDPDLPPADPTWMAEMMAWRSPGVVIRNAPAAAPTPAPAALTGASLPYCNERAARIAHPRLAD